MNEPLPTFTLHTDPATGAESITVDFWPDQLPITARVLEHASGAYVRRDRDEITIRCANGEATYRIVEDRVGPPGFYHTVAVKRTRWGLPTDAT